MTIQDIKNIPETGFYFDDKKHFYYLDGKKMTGVTTILNVMAKPQLIPWAARMAIENVKENFAAIIAATEAERDVLLKTAQNAHAQKKDKAADIGTLVHKAIEEWIKEKKTPTLDDQGMMMFNQFIKWAEDNKVKFLDSERRVYSKEHFVAGTLDFIFEMGGKKYLGDFKTSSGIYGREYFWQCAGYRMMLEENGEKDFNGSVIVRCGKDGSFEVKESYDYETDIKGFMAALTIYRLINNY